MPGCSRSTASASCSARCSTCREELDIDALPDDDPEIEGYVLYGYLSMLLDESSAALEPG